MNIGDRVIVVFEHHSISGTVTFIDPTKGIMVRHDLGNGCFQSKYYSAEFVNSDGDVIYQWLADANK